MSYSVGDLVIYERQFYKCLDSTTGAWDSEKWQVCTVAEFIKALETSKVDKTTTIAGIDLQDNITEDELMNALFDITVVSITH